jgi:hypothetical protein
MGYIDPGSGALIWQFLVAIFFSSIFFIKKFFSFKFLRKKRKKDIDASK